MFPPFFPIAEELQPEFHDPEWLEKAIIIEAFRSLLRGDAVLGERHMQLFPERPPLKVVLYGPVVQYPHENRTVSGITGFARDSSADGPQPGKCEL